MGWEHFEWVGNTLDGLGALWMDQHSFENVDLEEYSVILNMKIVVLSL